MSERTIEDVEIYPLDIKRDERGWLAEILRAEKRQVREDFAQLYVTVALPGKTKGRHYHRRKVEWFCVVSGEALLILKDTRTGEELRVPMGEENTVTVRIPPHIAHAITNTGTSPAYLIVVVSEQFNPKDPDTFPYNFEGL
jgi:UDP-2-acetamido-2,6-beta-L-arabino-hexul-4-ose reductase